MCFAYYVNKCILNKSRGSPGKVLEYSDIDTREKKSGVIDAISVIKTSI